MEDQKILKKMLTLSLCTCVVFEKKKSGFFLFYWNIFQKNKHILRARSSPELDFGVGHPFYSRIWPPGSFPKFLVPFG